MKIGVYKPAKVPRSMTITTGCISAELEGLGAQLLHFTDPKAVPEEADVIWDPWVGGGYTSVLYSGHTSKPIVPTVAGAALFSVPLSESGLSLIGKLRAVIERARLRRRWRQRVGDYARVITISDYAKQELCSFLPLIPERVVPIHLGKDARLVELEEAPLATELNTPYFLHLSFYQPKKNVDRMIEAYISVADQPGMPDLVVVSTGYPGRQAHPKLRLIPEDVSRSEIATYYRHALGFIFPSLHETFGMPLTEAMLFGLPLITANTTVCPETAGEAALLVDPMSTSSIAAAITRLAAEGDLRSELSLRSKARGEEFSWRKTAESYLRVFDEVLSEAASR